MRASLAVGRREHNALSLAADVEHSTVETEQHSGAAFRRCATKQASQWMRGQGMKGGVRV
jgi:hypothetical protein